MFGVSEEVTIEVELIEGIQPNALHNCVIVAPQGVGQVVTELASLEPHILIEDEKTGKTKRQWRNAHYVLRHETPDKSPKIDVTIGDETFTICEPAEMIGGMNPAVREGNFGPERPFAAKFNDTTKKWEGTKWYYIPALFNVEVEESGHGISLGTPGVIKVKGWWYSQLKSSISKVKKINTGTIEVGDNTYTVGMPNNKLQYRIFEYSKDADQPATTAITLALKESLQLVNELHEEAEKIGKVVIEAAQAQYDSWNSWRTMSAEISKDLGPKVENGEMEFKEAHDIHWKAVYIGAYRELLRQFGISVDTLTDSEVITTWVDFCDANFYGVKNESITINAKLLSNEETDSEEVLDDENDEDIPF